MFEDKTPEALKQAMRIIIVSTHIIEEIAKTIQKLIIIDKGSIRFFDNTESAIFNLNIRNLIAPLSIGATLPTRSKANRFSRLSLFFHGFCNPIDRKCRFRILGGYLFQPHQ